MRYAVHLRDTHGVEFILGGSCLPAARDLARLMNGCPGDPYPYWEVVDSYSGQVVESSDSANERKRKS